MTRWQEFNARDDRNARLRLTTSPARTALLVVVGLLLASLLAAPGLLETAERQPYGAARDGLVVVAEGLAAVSGATRLDVPWRTLDGVVHPATPGEEPLISAGPAAEPPLPPAPSQPTSPAPSPTPSAPPASSAPPATSVPAPSPSPATTPDPAPGSTRTPRVPTTADPLRVWIAGDSMWERPGPSLVADLEATGVVDVVGLEFRYSTGLTRPDFFDWPAHAAAQVRALDPELVLFLLGPNDSQPLVEGGVRHDPGTDGFDAAYGARVRALMEVAAGDARQVLWIGLPVMRDPGFDQRMQDLDAAYAAAADLVDGVDHVPTRALFSDAGRYAEYLPGPDGTSLPMRNRDGIHLSSHGADRLARVLFEHLDARHRFAG